MRMSGNRVIGNAARSPDHFSPMVELAPVMHTISSAAPIALRKRELKESETLSAIRWFSIFLNKMIKSNVAQQVIGSIAILERVMLCKRTEQPRKPIVAASEERSAENRWMCFDAT